MNRKIKFRAWDIDNKEETADFAREEFEQLNNK